MNLKQDFFLPSKSRLFNILLASNNSVYWWNLTVEKEHKLSNQSWSSRFMGDIDKAFFSYMGKFEQLKEVFRIEHAWERGDKGGSYVGVVMKTLQVGFQ